MYVNVAVLKETQPHERRVALVPSVVGKLIKLGAKLHMQSGAGDSASIVDAAFKDVSFTADRHALVSEADVVLGVQASGAGRDQRDEGRRDPDLLHLCGQRTRVGETSFGQEDHLLCHGQDSAHHARASHGRAIQSVGLGRLLRRAARCYPSRASAAKNHVGCGSDRARPCPCDGPRRRGPRSRCYRAPSWRRRRGV